MSLILAYKNRGITRDLTIQNAAGTAIVPGVNDLVRVLIGREGETPKLTVIETPTAAGSVVTKNSPTSGTNRLRLDATDLDDIDPGVYTLFVDYFDNADAAEWKNVDRQVFCLEDT